MRYTDAIVEVRRGSDLPADNPTVIVLQRTTNPKIPYVRTEISEFSIECRVDNALKEQEAMTALGQYLSEICPGYASKKLVFAKVSRLLGPEEGIIYISRNRVTLGPPTSPLPI